MSRDQVFISYSHKDTKWLECIQKMLSPYADMGLDIWSDQRILSGQEWRVEIDASLARASVAVLLVSDNFLASTFIKQNELPPLLDAANEKKTIILPILIDHCCYEVTAIVRYQSPIRFKTPLRELLGATRTKAIKQIAVAIHESWQRRAWSQSIPDGEAARAAIADFLKLADRFAAIDTTTLDACFRRAVRECHGDVPLHDLFPQLPRAQVLGWPELSSEFRTNSKPSAELVEALARLLARPLPKAVPITADDSCTIALVVRRAGSSARGTLYYTWSAFVQDDASDNYQLIGLDGLDRCRNEVVFENPMAKETGIDTVLRQLIGWCNVNTILPVLEIFAPTELLDAPWADLMVEEDDTEPITLLESIPYYLRPVDRLEDDLNFIRPCLQKKLEHLYDGKGQWAREDDIIDSKYLRSSVIEEHHLVAVKWLQSFPSDETKRAGWFKALIKSMVPIAIWRRHGNDHDLEAHVDRYAMFCGHADGGPVSAECLDFHAIARNRKKFGSDRLGRGLAPHLVLMLDHWQRIPPITPQARGASRAISP